MQLTILLVVTLDGPALPRTMTSWFREVVMPLKSLGVIEIPIGADSDFDHAALDPKTRRVFIAHTARDCIEVIDHDQQKYIATLPGVAGAVADDGDVLTTDRGAATITWLDAATYDIKGVFPSGLRPNGAAILKCIGIGVAACIGDAHRGPALQIIDLKEVTQRGTAERPFEKRQKHEGAWLGAD